MKNQAIFFTEPGKAELLEEELRELKDNEVLVKLAYSTISSGTERANLIGHVNIGITGSGNPPFPRIVGYCSSGVVEKIGEKVEGLEVGDRVAVSWGKHRQYMILTTDNVHKITDDNISLSEAATWQIATFPMAAIRKCRLEFGESAIVMGLGVLGLFAVKLLRVAGATPIIAVDPVPEKRELALKIGADYAFDPFAPDFAEQVKKVTDGGAKVGIEVTGVGAGLDGILDCMARFGRVALLGCTRDKEFSIDYYRKVHGPGITLVGAHTIARPDKESSSGWWTLKDEMAALQKFCTHGRLEFESLVEEIHSPAEATEVYTRLANEKAFPLVQFDWGRL